MLGTPLAEYAYAIVLCKRLRFDDAEVRLGLARGSEAEPFLSARRALARLQLDRGGGQEALKEAMSLADACSPPDGPDDASAPFDAQRGAAHWLGRPTGALASPDLAIRVFAKELEDVDETIRRSLGRRLADADEAGKAATGSDREDLAAAVESEIARRSDLLRDEKAAESGRIAESRSATEDRTAEVVRTAEDRKRELDGRLRTLDADLSRLDASFRFLKTQKDDASATVNRRNAEIARRELNGESVAPPAGNSAPPTNLPLVVASRDQAVARRNQASAQAAEIGRQAGTLSGRRSGLVRQNEQETQALALTAEAVRKRGRRLDRQAAAADAAGRSVGADGRQGPPSMPAESGRVHSVGP